MLISGCMEMRPHLGEFIVEMRWLYTKQCKQNIYTMSTALMQPSFSGWLVTCAYLPQITLPDCVTKPSSLMFTSITVPLVITPSEVYIGELGFFFTPMIGKLNVAFSSGCVTCAVLKRKAIGRMNRSNFGGFRVNPSPTKQAFVTNRFQDFFFRFPVWMALKRVQSDRINMLIYGKKTYLNTSTSETAFTLGIGTSHLPAFSFRFCLIIFDSTLARVWFSRSSR